MILDTLELSIAQLQERTGWELKPEGACKDNRCVPMADLTIEEGHIDVSDFARRMGMPVAHDERHELWALGPESGGHVLENARFPHIELNDFDSKPFDLSTLRDRKVLLIAWASY
jgi:hypothetical protein